jgi:hemolysin III
LDHSAIYILIAGTYTPFCVLVFSGFFHWGMLAVVWSFALAGIVVKIFYVKAPRWLNASIYVLMGWLGVAAFGQITAFSADILVWLVIGGVIYTLGAVVYSTKLFNFIPGKFGFHEVWHLFVLAGATAHFISVLLLVI